MTPKYTNRKSFIVCCACLTLASFLPLRPMCQPIPSGSDTVDLRTGKYTGSRFWIHEKMKELPLTRFGPFVNIPKGRILTVDSNQCHISNDEGKTWTSYPIFRSPDRFLIRPERALIRTKKGTIILAFANDRERSKFNWDRETHDVKDAELPTYAVRSDDDGRTWSEPQLLHREWTGAVRDIIETKDGHVIFTSMMVRSGPGHHAVVTYTSANEGMSWTRSNIVDLGGIGDHDGTIESTLEEMKDGRLLMFLRTNWGYFWETWSSDKGITWKDFRSTPIDASSSPGMFKRLASGTLVMVWNRYYPQGKTTVRLVGGDRNFSAFPVSLHRDELSFMYSLDEGKTWSKPLVIAKTTEPKTQISYPYLFERRPGEVWLTFPFSKLWFSFREKDLVPGKPRGSK
jgi:hypothetical protein